MLGLTIGSAAWVFQGATEDVTSTILNVFKSPYNDPLATSGLEP
jgi:hypothetical protein